MVFTLTTLAELIGFLATSLLAYCFYIIYQKDNSVLSKLFFYITVFFSLYFFFTGFGLLFFPQSSLILKTLVVIAVFLESLACAIMGYAVIYLSSPKIKPFYGFLFIFILGLLITIFTIKIPFSPVLESAGAVNTINWNTPFIIGIFQFLIFFITFIPLSILFFHYSKFLKLPFIKIRAIGMGLMILLGLNAAFIDYFLEGFLNLIPLCSDFAIGFFGICLILTLIYFSFQGRSLTQKVSLG